MIYGIGVDMVEISRMDAGLQRFGRRLVERILSESELSEFDRNPRPAHFLARRFAAKEALVKAAGTGFRDGLFLREISIRSNALGKPELVFSGKARGVLDRLGIAGSHVSISDEREYALACVLLERA